MKTCSVIVPAYNVEPSLLKRCIESVHRQTYPACELIIADDGSDIPVEGAIRMPHRGQGATRNAALKYATGEYIMYLDADDYLEPDCVERAMKAIGTKDVLQFGRLPFYHQTAPWARLYRREIVPAFAEGCYYEDVYFSVRLWLSHPTYRRIRYRGYHYEPNKASTTSHPHPKDEQAVIQWLHTQLKTNIALHDKLLICYTLLRLKIHFMI